MNCLILGYPTKKQPQTEISVKELQKEITRLRGQVGGLKKSNNLLRGKLDGGSSS